MSRILWLSNAPWTGSGYGEQTATFLPRFKKAGHDVAILCNYGVQDGVFPWEGIPVYPTDNDWGNKSIGTWKDIHRADLIIALCDSFILQPDKWPEGIEMAVWAPIDHQPIPPAVLAVLSHPKIRPIAMCRFGERVMQAADLDPCYVPHGVDTSVFKPMPEIRDAIREEMGIPSDAFLVGMVAANKSQMRKSFHPAFHAFSNFAKTHDDAFLYAHTQIEGLAGLGIDLKLLAHAVGIADDRIMFPQQRAWDLGMPAASIAALYQAFDVLLMPSMGEGFGIPLIEAQACGVPVITSDHTAMTELCGAGWLVEGDPWWDPPAASFFTIPHIQSVTDALESAYHNAAGMRDKAAEFGAGYDADTVMRDYWTPTLAKLGPPESRQVRRARERQAAKVAA